MDRYSEQRPPDRVGELVEAPPIAPRRVEVYGTGCARCRVTVQRVKEAIAQSGVDATVTHVTEFEAMKRAGVRALPSVAVDGTLVHSATVPTVDQAVAWLLLPRLQLAAGATLHPPGSTP